MLYLMHMPIIVLMLGLSGKLTPGEALICFYVVTEGLSTFACFFYFPCLPKFLFQEVE
jgi:hypothetical protein